MDKEEKEGRKDRTDRKEAKGWARSRGDISAFKAAGNQ